MVKYGLRHKAQSNTITGTPGRNPAATRRLAPGGPLHDQARPASNGHPNSNRSQTAQTARHGSDQPRRPASSQGIKTSVLIHPLAAAIPLKLIFLSFPPASRPRSAPAGPETGGRAHTQDTRAIQATITRRPDARPTQGQVRQPARYSGEQGLWQRLAQGQTNAPATAPAMRTVRASRYHHRSNTRTPRRTNRKRPHPTPHDGQPDEPV